MKKLIVSLLTLSLAATLLTGCSVIFREVGKGEIVEQAYDFKDFTNVQISDVFEYEITQSDTYSVVVSARESSFSRLDIRQSGDTLYIGIRAGIYNDSDPGVVVTMPQLDKLDISGVCEGKVAGFDSTADLEIYVSGTSTLDMNMKAGNTVLHADGATEITGDLTSAETEIELSGVSELDMNLKTGKTVIKVYGSSEMKGNLQALDLQLDLEGVSKCELTGSAGDTVLFVSGSSEMDSPDLVLQNADVELSGSSYADIYTDGSLSINVSGVSELDYAGNPTIVKIDTDGSSEINHK